MPEKGAIDVQMSGFVRQESGHKINKLCILKIDVLKKSNRKPLIDNFTLYSPITLKWTLIHNNRGKGVSFIIIPL